MTDTLQFRRGSTAKTSAFTGLAGEITVDTDKKVAVIHDGSAQGGFPLLRDDLSNVAGLQASLIPATNAAFDLGSAAKHWKTAYLNTVSATAVTATTFTGALVGNADTATAAGKLATPRTISLSGSVTGSAAFDGSGDITIATTGGTNGAVNNVAGTMRILVQEQVLSSPATTLTFSGLDGDTDTEYEIVATMVSNSATAAYMVIRPNGDATAVNYRTSMVYSITGSTAAGYYDTTIPGWRLAYTNGTGQISTGRVTIQAKSGTIRSYVGEYIQAVSAGANGNMFAVGGEWSNTAANITSLVLTADNGTGTAVTNGFAAGTRIALYARRQVGGATSNVSASFRGALLKRSTATSIPNATWTTVAWESSQYDTDGFFTTGNPTRLTVPAGVNKIRLTSGISVLGSGIHTRISKNGTQVYPAPYLFNSNATPLYLSTAVFPVQAGDYFTVDIYQSSGSAQVLNNPEFCYFGLEVVDPVPVAVSGFGSNTTADYALLGLSANQTTGLTVGSYVKFGAITGSGVTLDTATGKIRLKAGKTYALTASLFPTFSAANGQFYVQWRNVTANTLLGSMGGSDNEQATYNQSAGSLCQAVVTPMVDTDVALEVTISGSVTSVLAGLSSAMVTQVGGPANGLNYGPAGYGYATLAGNITVPATGSSVPFNALSGNLTLSNGGITLKAGRVYLLQGGAHPDYSAATGILDVQFWDGTTTVGIMGEQTPPTYGSNTGGSTTTVTAIVRPSVDTTYYLKVVRNQSASTLYSFGTYMMAVELASAVDTFSTNETLTNRVWIDGKPVYRKVVNLGALPNATTATIAHGITGITEVVDFRGVAKNSSGNRISLPYPHSSSPNAIVVNVDNTNIQIVAAANWSGYSGYLTIEYTK